MKAPLFKTVKSFVGRDESVHGTLADWKANEIRIELSTARLEDVPGVIVQNADAIVAILRQRERKPRALKAPSKKTAVKRLRKLAADATESVVA